MKKAVFKAIALLLLFSIIFALSGCRLFLQSLISENETGETTFRFYSYSQRQKQAYVESYIKKKYDMSCEMETIEKHSLSPLHSQKDYVTKVKMTDGTEMYLWIDDDGNIVDGMFLNELEDDVLELLETFISEEFPESVICLKRMDVTTMPTRYWSESDDIQLFLATEDVYSDVRVFVDDPTYITKESFSALEEKLNFCEVSIWFNLCDDLETLNVDDFDLKSDVDMINIHKKA